MIRELANVLGIAEDKVKEAVEAGKVGFPEVQKVIQNLTNEGGMFYNLMAEQSKTITGQIANIEDAISSMFNEIGRQNEGVINTALGGVASLVENYERTGRVLAGLAMTYGTYRTAVMLATAAKGWATAAEALYYNWLLLAEKAQKLLNRTMLSNPYVLVATAVAGVVTALASMKTETERMREAEQDYQAEKQKTIEAEQEHMRKMERLCDIAGDEAVATDTRREALNKLEMKYPDIFAQYDTEYEKLKNIKKIKEEIAALEGGKSITQTRNELSEVERRIKELENKAKEVKYQTYTVSGGASYTMKIGGLSSQEEAELKNLRNKRTSLRTQVRKDDVNVYYADLTGISNEDLAAQIRQRKTLLAAMDTQEKKYGRITYGANTGTYSRDELQYQLNKLQSEQNRRTEKRESSADWGAAAKKKYEEALKAYNDFISNRANKLTEGEYEKERKKLKDALDEAKKAYDAAKPGENKDDTKADKQREKEEEKEKRELEKQKKAERERSKELQEMRWDNEQAEIDQMKEGSEQRIKQIKLDYEKETAAIQEQEAKWREAQGGTLTKEQSAELKDRYTSAQAVMEHKVKEVEADEVKKGREKLDELLKQYKDYDQRRRDIDTEYAADMETLQAELKKLQEEGGDTQQVESAIRARTDAYKKAIQDLQGEILQSTTFYDKLFSDTSEKGYKTLRDFYKQAQEVLSGAKVGADGVDITITDKDSSGNFVKKTVRVTVAEYQKMKKQVDTIRKQLEKSNPFAALKTSWSELMAAMKDGGDVTGALQKMNAKGKEVTQIIRGWSEDLGAVFGDRFSQSMDEILTFCDGAMDMGTGIAKIWSGDIVGGITNTLSGLGSIVSMFTSWKEKMEEMKRQWYIAEIETNRAIRERNEEYAASQSAISDIIKDVETLNWLVEHGYAKASSVSVWEAQSEALAQYMSDLEAETKDYDSLWEKLQGSNAHWEWGNSLNGGSVTMSLRGMSAEQIELYYNQNKLSDAARDYYEAWVASGESVEELTQQIEECYTQMREMVMGVSFDSFLSNAADALKEMRSDVGALGEFTEDTLSEAILNAFKYKTLATVLEPLYNELSEALINGTADKAYIEEWRRKFEETMTAANEQLEQIEEATGVDTSDSGTSQSAKSGGFTAMTQDQGTKLEGMFTSGLQHWSSMDTRLEDVAAKMGLAEGHLAKIEENTGLSASHLSEIKEDLRKVVRDGLKVK